MFSKKTNRKASAQLALALTLTSTDEDLRARRAAAESLASLSYEELIPVLVTLAEQVSEGELEAALSAWLDLQGSLPWVVGLREAALADPAAKPIAQALLRLLRVIYAGVFLEVKPLTWLSPAILLERVMQLEQVHRFEGWADMKNRLDLDRRLFVLTHITEPLMPVAFLEVALTRDLADSVQAILNVESEVVAPNDARFAIFYSINSVQPGLKGISFGEALIHAAVEQLTRSFPRLQGFSTLSPIPSLRKWLRNLKAEELARYDGRELRRASLTPETLLAAMEGGSLPDDKDADAAARVFLTQAAADYLTGGGSPQAVKDPVAKFHLGNGARLERINWAGDRSDNGWRQSFGLMVNYVYDLDDLEGNRRAFRQQGPTAASREVARLARLAQRRKAESTES